MLLDFDIFLVYVFIFLQDCYLVYILEKKCGISSMVFTRTGNATRFIALMLRNLGLRAISISGKMTQVLYINLNDLQRFWFIDLLSMLVTRFYLFFFKKIIPSFLLILIQYCDNIFCELFFDSQRDLKPWISLRRESAIFLSVLM